MLVRVELDYGRPEHYCCPWPSPPGPMRIRSRWKPEAVVADVHADGREGVLYDAAVDPAYARAVAAAIGRRRAASTGQATLAGAPSRHYRAVVGGLDDDAPVVPITAEQSNTSVTIGERAMLKFVRRVEEGVNPGVELGRFLDERAGFRHAPQSAGSLELRLPGAAPSMTVAVLEQYVQNEGDGWGYVVDSLGHGLDEAVAHAKEDESGPAPPPGTSTACRSTCRTVISCSAPTCRGPRSWGVGSANCTWHWRRTTTTRHSLRNRSRPPTASRCTTAPGG